MDFPLINLTSIMFLALTSVVFADAANPSLQAEDEASREISQDESSEQFRFTFQDAPWPEVLTQFAE